MKLVLKQSLLTLAFASFAVVAFAQIPKVPKVPKVEVPKVGTSTSTTTSTSTGSNAFESPAKSDMENFNKQAEKMQYCLDNKVWQDQNSNQYKSMLSSAEKSLEAIKTKDAKKAGDYEARYKTYFDAYDKHLDAEATAKGVRRRKVDVSTSPAAASIKDFRNQLSVAKESVTKGYDDAGNRTEKLAETLAKIKKEDPNWAEYALDEADYMDIKNLYDKNQYTAKYRRIFEGYTSFPISSMTREPWNYKGYAEKVPVKEFQQHKADYMAQTNQDDYVLKHIAKCDEFFSTTVPKIKEAILKDANKALKDTEYWAKENRTKADFLKDFSTSSNPGGAVKTLETSMEVAAKGFFLLPDDADIKAVIAKAKAQHDDVKQYIDGGQHAKDVATKKQMIIDAERLDKAATTDASLDAILKRDINVDKYGAVQRISITSRDWSVRKNEFDLPLEKVMYVEAATKKDGKCYRVIGKFVMTYEGGGTYGKPYYQSQNSFEMNCANIMK